MSSFTHLHLHTEYSILDGVAKVIPLLDKVKELGMNSCAITDHGVLYGAFEFWSYANEIGVKPILGCEVYVAPKSRFEKPKDKNESKYFHLTLLAKNKEGYQNLVKLVSRGALEGFYYKPRVDKELLSEYAKGLICLTGCPNGPINQSLLKDNEKLAHEWMGYLLKTYDDLYFELSRSSIPDLEDLESKQIDFNKKYNLPYVATVDTHYIEKEDYKLQEIAWCISDGRLLDDPGRRQYPSTEFYLKTPEEMALLFKDIPEALENTQKIADMVEEYKITFDRIQPQYYAIEKGKTAETQLRDMVFDRFRERYEELTDDIKERIEYELKIIHDKGYDDYFLVVQDYCKWARDNDILVGPGRGSGAGSVVAYILGITNIDPLRYDLIFERFLNPERNSPPDFDIDFQDDKRDELFKYMSDTYGHDNTAFMITFGRLKTKAAIRDICRVMGIDLQIADQLSKMVTVKFGKVTPIKKMMEASDEFKEIIESSPQLQEMAEYVSKLENIARHLSMHACGYLVTPEPIVNYVPIQKEAKGGDKVITQFEGGPLEYMGLMKFDFLGLSNLTIIKNTLKQIKYTTGEEIDIDNIPLDDKKTFELFQKGNTKGIFQFESDGMQKYLRDLKPTQLEDLFFMNAAYRPGPMQYIPDYIDRKFGRQEVVYLHDDLKPILETTYGFAIYQEQVMQIAVDFAGYSLGEADMLRRAMGKKKKDIMAQEKIKFIKGAKDKGYSEKLAIDVFAYLEPFADYGFNKSHSACYSLIAYQTAYLKANYTVQFLAGLMETDLGDADKVTRDLLESKELGIKILPPNVNESFFDFKISKDKESIRFGLGAIKNAGEKGMRSVVKERQKNGNFKNFDDLVKRIGAKNISKKDLECLIKVGAMDEFGYRSQLLEVVNIVYEKIQGDEKNREGGQSGLFATLSDSQNILYTTKLPDVPKESDQERIIWEKELLGTYLSSHPLQRYVKFYLSPQINTINSVIQKRNKKPDKKKLLAMISTRKTITTKKGDKMAFVEIEDMENRIEGVIFPRTYEVLKDKIEENVGYIFEGSVNERDEKFNFVIDDIQSADKLKENEKITISIVDERDETQLEKLRNLIVKNQGEVELTIIYGSRMKTYKIIKKIKPEIRLIEFLKYYQTSS